MKVVFYNRDFSDMPIQPNVELTVERYSKSTFGGPKLATISVSGFEDDIYGLANYLRCPVEIINDHGDAVWWGYLSRLDINMGSTIFGVDIETMSNNVAVAYTDQGERYTTDWSSDSDSINEYGTKEILLSKANTTAADALQFRDVYLANAKYPIPVMRFGGSVKSIARLTCRGWIYTLDWEYYANATGREAYEEIGTGGREIGEDDRPILAQSFEIAATSSWDASSIWLRVWKQGTSSPTDNLVVSLKADNAGEPGATLASGLVDGDDIGTSAEWTEFVLDSAVTLNTSTTYWIHAARSGSVDADAYFMVDTNFLAGYPRGELFLYNTSLGAWGEDIYIFWGDLLFIVVGDTENTNQITTLVSTSGQYFNGAIIEDTSGLTSNPYRSGDTTAYSELLDLLNTGTSNDRRLLCEVTRNRYLRIYEEPEKPSKNSDSDGLNRNNELVNAYNVRLDDSYCPVGYWCSLKDIVPASVDYSLISDPSIFMVDEAQYDAVRGEYHILGTRNQSNQLDIGGVVQG